MMTKLQILLVSILVFLLLSYKINQPFWGHHEFNGVYYGMIAKNYLRYGLWATKGGQVNNLYPVPASEFNYHVNHPATYPLLLAAAFRIFAASESTARLVSIVASVLGIVFLGKFITALYKDSVSWLAVVAVIFTPLFLYYGSLPVFEPLLFPVVTAGLWKYWTTRRIKLPWSVISISFLAMLIDWPGFWLAIFLAIYEFLSLKRRRFIGFLIGSLLLAFLLILAHQFLASGSAVEALKSVFSYRLGISQQPYTTLAWVRLLLTRSRAFWGLPIIVAVGLGFLIALRSNQKLAVFLSAILGLSLMHILVFRNITWYHDYMLYHTIPFVGVSLGSLFHSVFVKTKSKVLVYTLCGFLVATTILATSPFFIALVSMHGYKDCIEMGYAVRISQTPLTFRLSEEKAKECPPFIGFYGEKPFEVKAY